MGRRRDLCKVYKNSFLFKAVIFISSEFTKWVMLIPSWGRKHSFQKIVPDFYWLCSPRCGTYGKRIQLLVKSFGWNDINNI